MQAQRLTILTFVGYYLPAYKSGGPVRSISNMVDNLGDELDFRIVTSDRDLGDNQPFPDIEVDQWNQVGKAKVLYLSPSKRSLRSIRKIIVETDHDVLYLNGFFHPRFTVLPLIVRRTLRSARPTVLAPRGEFSIGALKLKAWKKRTYIGLAKRFNLYKNILWHASSVYEKDDIQRILGNIAQDISIAVNLPASFSNVESTISAHCNSPSQGRSSRANLNIIYLARVSPKKNLAFALRILNQVDAPIRFDIFGPVDDMAYWNKCKLIISEMRHNVRVTYHGAIDHREVASKLSLYDLYFLPTLGENYGHTIFESLTAGTPVLISDKTPWRDLEDSGVGWDLPLSDESRFCECIRTVASINRNDSLAWRARVRSFALRHYHQPENVKNNLQLFQRANTM